MSPMHLYLLLLVHAINCQPFILRQSIGGASVDSIFDISANSEILVVSSLNEPMSIFIN